MEHGLPTQFKQRELHYEILLITFDVKRKNSYLPTAPMIVQGHLNPENSLSEMRLYIDSFTIVIWMPLLPPLYFYFYL